MFVVLTTLTIHEGLARSGNLFNASLHMMLRGYSLCVCIFSVDLVSPKLGVSYPRQIKIKF